MRRAILTAAVAVLSACGPTRGLEASADCASGLVWSGGNSGSPEMNPGHACVACHVTEKPRLAFAIAGTVYPKSDEQNGCAGTATGMTIEITDATGKAFALTPNAAGNFYVEGPIATPYRAKLIHPNGERVMAAAQTNGDCNSCHTSVGLEGAPGRIAP